MPLYVTILLSLHIFISTVLIVLFVLSKLSNSLWFCHKMQMHIEPDEIKFNGLTYIGVCPRCGKDVQLDSQGNWF